MARHIPQTIREVGLKNYLTKTKTLHNDFGYEEFVKMAEEEVNKSNIAKAFKVDRRTVASWLEVYEQELAEDGS